MIKIELFKGLTALEVASPVRIARRNLLDSGGVHKATPSKLLETDCLKTSRLLETAL